MSQMMYHLQTTCALPWKSSETLGKLVSQLKFNDANINEILLNFLSEYLTPMNKLLCVEEANEEITKVIIIHHEKLKSLPFTLLGL